MAACPLSYLLFLCEWEDNDLASGLCHDGDNVITGFFSSSSDSVEDNVITVFLSSSSDNVSLEVVCLGGFIRFKEYLLQKLLGQETRVADKPLKLLDTFIY